MVIYYLLIMKDNLKNRIIELYPDFPKKLLNVHPNLTRSEVELCIYLKFNLTDYEIAEMINRNKRTIETKRYRLRKKLNLQKTQRLNTYILKL